jgi:DNA-binding winged helix-turn-helix (wHTH) protein
MSRRNIYSVVSLVTILFSIWFFTDSGSENESFAEQVKVTLRNVGHQLLLSDKDTTSIVLPIVEIEKSKYRISFQNELSIDPGNLVTIIQKNFEKASLSSHYLVEVINCTNGEVAYSYEMKNTEENGIISCFGRILEDNCYTIEVKFTDRKTTYGFQKILYILVVAVFIIFHFIFYKRRETPQPIINNDKHTSIGRFKFYPDQNKLVREEIEINLSRKECELLSIFIDKPNQIIKRDELTKKVWEDNGVIVGRSLDTYISKLRKKLEGDSSIKLSNVHGVGYKLEINH